MNKLDRIWAALCSAAFAIAAAPALVLAQSTGGPSSPGTSPMGGGEPVRDGGGGGWLWLLLALAVIAVIWYAMSQRRPATRTRA
jgi:hypothetical protein